MTSALAFALLVATASPARRDAEPAVFSDALREGIWRVQGEIAGRKGVLALSTSASRVFVRQPVDGVEDGGEVRLKAGGQDLGDVPAWYAPLPGAPKDLIGVIGVSALQNRMVGFDAARGLLVVWPEDAEPRQAADWVAIGEGGGEVVSIPLRRYEEGYLALPVGLGGKERPMYVSSGTPQLQMLKALGTAETFAQTGEQPSVDAHTGRATTLPLGMIGPMTIGGKACPPVSGALVGEEELADYPEPPEGLMPIHALPYERVVLDFARGTLVVEPFAPAALADRWILQTLGVPLELRAGRLTVTSSLEPRFRPFSPYYGNQVLEIDGIPEARIVGAMEGFGPTSLPVGASLWRLRASRYVMLLQQPKGQFRLTVDRVP